ncbi:MAG: hypothetical protein IIA67_13855 [Planctomycetes bacterium]|nr:hypothetical protein [Planctomycetota bacterium]
MEHPAQRESCAGPPAEHRLLRPSPSNMQHFDGVILLNDNSAVTAWIAAGDLKK